DTARIEGEVHVGHLILNGTVVGPVHVAELLELQPKARIEGNVQYAALEMHQGAVVMGTLAHSAPGDVKLLPNLKLASNQD
ncbi:polymer-forming cytoskeletal protein, partial [Acinetobacter baumannii]